MRRWLIPAGIIVVLAIFLLSGYNNLVRLNEAVKKAESKGVKDTLVLMDQMAFIVSVNNSTVVTAMSGSDIQGNVFTQIDGAVVV